MTRQILFDLFSCQPYGRVGYHGGGAYGYSLFQLLFERGLFSKGPKPRILINRSKPIPDRINTIIRTENLAEYDIRSYDDVVVSGEEIRNSVLFSPVPYELVGYQERFAEFGIRVKGVIHGLRYVELGAEPTINRYRFSGVSLLKGLIRNQLGRYYQNRETKRSIRLAECLGGEFLTVSEHTFNVFSGLIESGQALQPQVAYMLPDSVMNGVSGGAEPSDRPYFIVVNSNRVEKNAFRVLQAITYLSDLVDLQVKFLGCSAIQASRWSRVAKKLGISAASVQFEGYLDRDVYERYYRGALGLVYPSLSEGFGYPPIEAMNMGLPVAASGGTAIPEACGDAALYFNPHKPLDIAAKMRWIYRDRSLRESLVERGYARVEELKKRVYADLDIAIAYITDRDS